MPSENIRKPPVCGRLGGGGDLREPSWGEKARGGIWPQDGGGLKPSGRHDYLLQDIKINVLGRLRTEYITTRLTIERQRVLVLDVHKITLHTLNLDKPATQIL